MQLKSKIKNLALKNSIPAKEKPANLRVFILFHLRFNTPPLCGVTKGKGKILLFSEQIPRPLAAGIFHFWRKACFFTVYFLYIYERGTFCPLTLSLNLAKIIKSTSD